MRVRLGFKSERIPIIRLSCSTAAEMLGLRNFSTVWFFPDGFIENGLHDGVFEDKLNEPSGLNKFFCILSFLPLFNPSFVKEIVGKKFEEFAGPRDAIFGYIDVFRVWQVAVLAKGICKKSLFWFTLGVAQAVLSVFRSGPLNLFYRNMR